MSLRAFFPIIVGKVSVASLAFLTVLSSGSLEAEDRKLEDNLDYIKKNAEEMVESKFKELGKPANRDFHSRGVCLKGTFTTFPQNLPKDMNVPFFATAATYPMYGRFSNGFPGRDSSDHVPSVFGFGVKVIGVPGKKFDMQSLGSTKPVNSNQDWNLATGPTFPIPTAAIYRENRELGLVRFALKYPEIANNVRLGLIHLESFLKMSYHSQVALHFGEDHIAKFYVMPCDGEQKTIGLLEAAGRSETYTTSDLLRHMEKKGACFSFNAQIRPADEKLPESQATWAKKYPRDNPTVLWPFDVVTATKLAEIRFPPQPKVKDLEDTCEDLSFNPGNTLQELRPIESDTLMRSRFLHAYEGSVSKRTSLNGRNGGRQSEPAQIPAEDLEKWLAE